jgi:lysophospholipase L1-like esterase/pimeloyl-ACP methyl ester carboxylesterase
MMRRILFLIPALLSLLAGRAQQPAWDDAGRGTWPEEFEVVEIPSPADNTVQKAYFYRAEGAQPRPLIVSLHTWSGDYTQNDPLALEIMARGYNYIHPDFRGVNNRPEATGSALAIGDIEEAIRYAVEHSNVDPNEVHVIGVSGGGMATLLAYTQLRYPVKSFSAWAAISDLEAWYWESLGRGQKYAQDILRSVSADETFDAAEARKRSPLSADIPARRQDAELFIYTGVHDGYTGSVPVTHSLRMYNLAAERWGAAAEDLVTEAEMLDLVTKRRNPAADPAATIDNRRMIHLQKSHGPVHLTVFEGGHEMLPRALSMIPVAERRLDARLNIFTIGDSNGNNPGGWVDQLKAMMPGANVFNTSQGGRTIAFNNNDREELNALLNLDNYLKGAEEHIAGGKYDYIIICLGTNDTKTEFADRQDEAVAGFRTMLDRIERSRLARRSRAKVIFVTPPPMGRENPLVRNTERNERIGALIGKLSAVAAEKGVPVVDVYHPMLGVFHHYAPDGTHMAPAGQKIIAARIVERIAAMENK